MYKEMKSILVRLALVFQLLLTVLFAEAYPVDPDTLMNLGLPVLLVETIDGEEPSCDYLSIADGYPGNTITNVAKVHGRLCVVERGDTLYDSGNFVKNESGMTIKIRGNSSAFYPKKPFKIKLQKKADLLFRGDKKYKDKDWVLLREDETSLNQMIALKLSCMMGLQWTPAARYVNVVVNGDFRGLYLLCESVKRNPDCRLDVDEEQGFIIERDAYWWNEAVYIESPIVGVKYTFKYPNDEDITEEKIDTALQRITEMEKSIYAADYDEVIDVRSFAAWLLTHDILGSADSGGSNMFLTWYDNEAKIMMGNIWDFDNIFSDEEDWSLLHGWGGFYFKSLMNSRNRAFALAYKDCWYDVRDRLRGEMDAYLDSLLTDSVRMPLDASRQMDFARWNVVVRHTVAYDVEKAKEWFAQHIVWLDDAIDAIPDDISTAVELPQWAGQHKQMMTSPVFTLSGVKVQKPKGVFVIGGKLMLAK